MHSFGNHLLIVFIFDVDDELGFLFDNTFCQCLDALYRDLALNVGLLQIQNSLRGDHKVACLPLLLALKLFLHFARDYEFLIGFQLFHQLLVIVL